MSDQEQFDPWDEIERLREQLIKTRTALYWLWKETVESGNHVANDYGWPKAREATLAALLLTDDQRE